MENLIYSVVGLIIIEIYRATVLIYTIFSAVVRYLWFDTNYWVLCHFVHAVYIITVQPIFIRVICQPVWLTNWERPHKLRITIDQPINRSINLLAVLVFVCASNFKKTKIGYRKKSIDSIENLKQSQNKNRASPKNDNTYNHFVITIIQVLKMLNWRLIKYLHEFGHKSLRMCEYSYVNRGSFHSLAISTLFFFKREVKFLVGCCAIL